VPYTYPVTSLEQYLTLFNDVKGENAIGEASPMYLNSPIAAARIKSSIPDVKLVASLRNPVDRAYSHYLMYYRQGKTKAPFIDAFRNIEAAESCCQHYVRTSFYAEKLKRYFDLFDRSQIKLIFLEDLQKNSISVIRELFQYLEVDETFVPEISKVHNLGGIPTSRTLHSLARYGFLPPRMYYRMSAMLKPLVPRFMVNFRRKMMRMSLDKPPPMAPEIRQQLIDFYREDILKTQELIQKDLSSWLQKD
jgi:hypothetical protein